MCIKIDKIYLYAITTISTDIMEPTELNNSGDNRVKKGKRKIKKIGKHKIVKKREPSEPSESPTEASQDIDTKEFIKFTAKNYMILILAVVPAFVIVRLLYNLEDPNFFYWLQVFERDIVYYISRGLGIPVQRIGDIHLIYDLSNTSWISQYPEYNEFNIQVASACTGVQEIVFLTTLFIGFQGPTLKTKLKWSGIFAVLIFIENILRMVANWFLLVRFGPMQWNSIHIFWWQYGQLIVIMCFFVIWYWFIARKEIAILKC